MEDIFINLRIFSWSLLIGNLLAMLARAQTFRMAIAAVVSVAITAALYEISRVFYLRITRRRREAHRRRLAEIMATMDMED